MKTFKQTVEECYAIRRQYQQQQNEALTKGYKLDGTMYGMIAKVIWDVVYDLDKAFDADPNRPNHADPIKPETMSQKELLFLAELLEQGAEAISNRICEDMSSLAYNLFTDEEKEQMAKDYEQWNSQGEEEAHFTGQAWPWMGWYAAKFRKAAEGKP